MWSQFFNAECVVAVHSPPTFLGHRAVKLLHDIADTWHVRKSSLRNWPAIHAGAALLVGAISVVVGLWWAVSGQHLRGACLFGLGVLCLVYWRYVLPKAMWNAKVERTLHGE
jgi:hypothetical protein